MLRPPKAFKVNFKLALFLFIIGVFALQYSLMKRIPKSPGGGELRPPAPRRFQVPPLGDDLPDEAEPVEEPKRILPKVFDFILPNNKPIKPPSGGSSGASRPSKKIPSECTNPVDLVNVLTGTASTFEHSIGNTLPLVSRPWAFNSWTLQTRPSGNPPGGWLFHPSDRTLHGGVRCTHQPSPWLGDYLNFNVFGAMSSAVGGRPFSAESRILKPHYLSIEVEDAGQTVKTEMTPTMHGTAFRFTFPNSTGPHYIGIDVGEVTYLDNRTVQIRLPHHNTPNFAMHILAQASQASTERSNAGSFWFRFPPEQRVVEFRLTTSLIGYEVANATFERETPWDLSFDDLVIQGQHEWNELLSRVCAEGFVGTTKEIFYTNLWRSLLFPRFSDEDVGTSTQHRSPYTKEVKDGPMVTDSGFWDSFSTVYPWLSLSYTPILGEIIQGWVNSYKESGWLPSWPSPYQRGVMVGTMGDATLADAIAKNISGFDRKTALEAIIKDGTVNGVGDNGRTCVHEYQQLGYVPSECGGNAAVGRSLYYYTADAAIAKAARLLGDEAAAKKFEDYAKQYPKQFNPATGFFQSKNSKGDFVPNFDSKQWQAGFTEGSAEQYRFNVPFDVEGLNKIMDGKLCDNIKRLVTNQEKPAFWAHEAAFHEMTEMAGQQGDFGLLGHNNQPSHAALHVAFKGGCYEVAETYVRKVIKLLYTQDAWAGDEDNGEMAAWYLLSAMGVYFLDLGSDEVVIGVPAVTHATMSVIDQSTGRSHELRIDAEGNTETARIANVSWIDAKGTETFLSPRVVSYRALTQGGTLKFYFR